MHSNLSQLSLEQLQEAAHSQPANAELWLELGQRLEHHGDPLGSLLAYHRAVTQAQQKGFWHSEKSTPAPLLKVVIHAITRLRNERRRLFYGSYESLRQSHGAHTLVRVDHALACYLKDRTHTPNSCYQKPRFFYFPDLPEDPYHDPYLQPWATQLQHAFPAIREEAVQTLAEDGNFENFIHFRPGVHVENYLKALGNQPPAWEAFFFYRRGQRYGPHHQRCPQTSALLESIELCRIPMEAPEICFSVMTPGTELLAHHGVTNIRLVMHLPLIVPGHCALNIHGGGEHTWQEGELMMFDDTYLHEAWNRSNSTRIILLMDCWNPALTAVEKQALTLLLPTIRALGRAAQTTEIEI